MKCEFNVVLTVVLDIRLKSQPIEVYRFMIRKVIGAYHFITYDSPNENRMLHLYLSLYCLSVPQQEEPTAPQKTKYGDVME